MRFIYIILFCHQFLISQNKTDFNLSKQFYVHGDAMTNWKQYIK